MARGRPRDAYSETWEWWRKWLAVAALFVVWPFLTLWIGIPIGISLTISTAIVVAVWRSLYAQGDPRLGGYMQDTWVYKIAAFVTRAKRVAAGYWDTWKKSKITFLQIFTTSVGSKMPFPDQWHLTPAEQRAFQESEANTPQTIKDYSRQFSWRDLIPMRLSTIWSLVFAFTVALVDVPVASFLTDSTVAWGVALPVSLSYPVSVIFLFFLAQYYNITRLTQGNWGETQALIPAPAIMVNRMTKEHWKPGVFTACLTAIIVFIIAASLTTPTLGLPLIPTMGVAAGVSVLIAAISVSARAMKPWRKPWQDYIDESRDWFQAIAPIFGGDQSPDVPTFMSNTPFPSDSEMEQITDTWRQKRDQGLLSDEEAEEAPKSTNRMAIFAWTGGATPNDLLGSEESIENRMNAPVAGLTFNFPERDGADGQPIPGTTTREGFRVIYSTDTTKDFSWRRLAERRYPIWDEELAINATVLKEARSIFKVQTQLVDARWYTTEDSPTHILEVVFCPVDSAFDLNDFNAFSEHIESLKTGVKWVRARMSTTADAVKNVSVVMSTDPKDDRIKLDRNPATVKRMIDELDWASVFRQAHLIDENGNMPEFKRSTDSTDLVTTTSLMLPRRLSWEHVKKMDEDFRMLTEQEFVEVKKGWDYSKHASEATKNRATHQKAFSVLSAPKDPLDQVFLFGDYADITLTGRTPYEEKIDWVAGINSADQPAMDSFLKGDAPHLLIAGESGSGKPVHPDTLVWTRDGLRKVSELSPGDFILGADGMFVRVKNVFATRPEADTFVVAAAGEEEEVQAAGKHLWPVRYTIDTLPQTSNREFSSADIHALDDLTVCDSEARQLIRSGVGESLLDDPINLKGRLPVPLNMRYSRGVGENSPEATNARSVHAMRGLTPHLAAVLMVFAYNERPDGHIVVNNTSAAKFVFSAAGYELVHVEALDNGSHHMWCADIHPLLSQIDFDNTDYPMFLTAMSGTDLLTIDRDEVRRECAAALVNCFVPATADAAGEDFFIAPLTPGVGASNHIEMFARLVAEAFGVRDNGRPPVRMADDVDGFVSVHSSAIRTARTLVSYDQLRFYVAAQHSAALGALSMLDEVSEDVYLLTHSELPYFLLMCGISVNTHEDNGGLLFIESQDVMHRRTELLPMDIIGDDPEQPVLADFTDVKMVHLLAGMMAAVGQVHQEDAPALTGSSGTQVTLHCADSLASLVLNVGVRGAAQLGVDEPLVRIGERPGEYIVHPEVYERSAGALTGNMNPAVGADGNLGMFVNAKEMVALVDRHAIVRMTGLSYESVAALLVNVAPVSATRCGYDMVSPTMNSVVHLVHGSRELYAAGDVAAALRRVEQQGAIGGRAAVAESVVTTFSLAYEDSLLVPRLVSAADGQSVPTPAMKHDGSAGDGVATVWVPVEVDSLGGESCEMMCITVEGSSHTFMCADNGLLTHNSVFVQSMLSQLAHNNSLTELLMWLLDPKIGLQRMMLLDVCEKFLDPWTPDTNFFSNTADFFAEGVERMANERNSTLAKTFDEETGVPPEKLGESREIARDWAASKGISPGDSDLMFPYIFMIIEECATVFADAGSKEESAFQADTLRCAGRIAREGRSAGVFETCMTQYPTNASIPSLVRNQMRRIGLRCRNSFASQIIIDEYGLEDLTLKGSAMLRDDNGDWRRARGFLMRNGRPSKGEENDLMDILNPLKTKTVDTPGMSKSASGAMQVRFADSIITDMEMLYDQTMVERASASNQTYTQFEQGAGASLEVADKNGKATKSKMDSESDLNRAMKSAGEKNSAPWLKFDENGKPISNAEYQRRAEQPAVPQAAKGRRSSGRKSRLKG